MGVFKPTYKFGMIGNGLLEASLFHTETEDGVIIGTYRIDFTHPEIGKPQRCHSVIQRCRNDDEPNEINDWFLILLAGEGRPSVEVDNIELAAKIIYQHQLVLSGLLKTVTALIHYDAQI